MPKKTNKQYYNRTNTCDRCGIKFEIATGHPEREYDEKGNWTGRWDCTNCFEKYDPNSKSNIIRSLASCRTGNQNPNHSNTKGKKSQKLACRLYGWKDLNEENDDYTTSIDCYDPKTGLYHQVQMRYYNSIERYWPFNGFEYEWEKIFEDMICFCFSKYGKIVERIYKFPWKEIMRVKGITVYKNPSKGLWYEKYRIKSEDELKKANEIWKRL